VLCFNGPPSQQSCNDFHHDHIKEPDAETLERWSANANCVARRFEETIRSSGDELNSGIRTLKQLIEKEEWLRSTEFLSARELKFVDMAYVWFVCADKEIWGFCLRRGPGEARFSDQECQLLHTFVEYFAGQKDTWYLHRLRVLTEREMEIVRETLDGLTANQIAEKLGISKFTVDTHKRNILRELQASSQVDVIRILLNGSSE
jgi:DNA-binding CsgD family transcriptional regulator